MKPWKTFEIFNSMPLTIIKNKIIDFVHFENPSGKKENFLLNGTFCRLISMELIIFSLMSLVKNCAIFWFQVGKEYSVRKRYENKDSRICKKCT
jgi:hypothetical protein